MTTKCYYCDKTTNQGGSFCSKHNTCVVMIKRETGNISVEASKNITKHDTFRRAYVVLKLLESTTDEDFIWTVLLKLNSTVLELVASIVTRGIDLSDMMQKVEKKVEKGERSEQDYVNISNAMRDIHLLREAYPTVV